MPQLPHRFLDEKPRAIYYERNTASFVFLYGGIIREHGGVCLCIGGVSDHVHLACSLSQNKCIADVVRAIKTNSSKWVHQEMSIPEFAWQRGYSAFTISKSSLPDVCRYIENQESHHKRMSFVDELVALLKRHEIEYDEKYLVE